MLDFGPGGFFLRLETTHMCSKPGGLGSQTHFLMTPEISWPTGQGPRSARLRAAMERMCLEHCWVAAVCFFQGCNTDPQHSVLGKEARPADPARPQRSGTELRAAVRKLETAIPPAQT